MNKLRITSAALACFLSVYALPPCPAQQPPPTTRPADRVLTAKEFESLIDATRTRLDVARQKPDALVDLVLARLRDNRSYTTNSIMSVVHAIRGYESGKALEHVDLARDGPPKWTFPATKQFIATVLPLVAGDVRTEAELYNANATALDNEGDSKSAAVEFGRAAEALRPLGYAIDLTRMESLKGSASNYFRLHQYGPAEVPILDVLSYSWFLVTDMEFQERMKNAYVEAGSMRIQMHRHDLAALQQIFFIESTSETLGRELEKAVDEAMRDGGVLPPT